MARTHQPGEAVFRSVLPEDIEWKPLPAFPPAVRLAIIVGQPSESGPYVIRVKVPSGVKLMPHRHPEDRIYTVMSGVFYVGLGDRFDGDKVAAYPPGSVIVLPGDTYHFHWAKSGEYVTQVSAIGPLGLEYLDPGDDPRELDVTTQSRSHRCCNGSHPLGTPVERKEAFSRLLDQERSPRGTSAFLSHDTDK
jgi:quercetin dioxygenase-like cupin family protein